MADDTKDRPFEGQLALVTGASKGIGAAIATELAGRGAHVLLVARDDRKLEAVEESIHAAGGSATIAPLDLAEPESVARLAQAIAGRWDALDMLVINAAVLPPLAPVQDIEPKGFAKALTVNVLATQSLLAGFHPLLKNAADPRLVGITSSVGAKPRAFWGGYGSSKAAFDSLLGSYAAENDKATAIRTLIVDPGATRTDMRARAFPGEDPNTVKTPDVVAREVADCLDSGFTNGHYFRVNQ